MVVDVERELPASGGTFTVLRYDLEPARSTVLRRGLVECQTKCPVIRGEDVALHPWRVKCRQGHQSDEDTYQEPNPEFTRSASPGDHPATFDLGVSRNEATVERRRARKVVSWLREDVGRRVSIGIPSYRPGCEADEKECQRPASNHQPEIPGSVVRACL
jgi:hypothetical protein